MGSFWWGQSALDELIEKATSELLPAGQVDLALHLEISDQIRSKKVNPKDAIKSLKQRLEHKNPNVILATLSLIDTCVKNSGSSFVKEVATRDFMEQMTHLLKTGCNQDVKTKVLSLIQVWGIASKGNNSLSYISGTYSLLKVEGYVFPPVTEKIDSILLETAVAPEWTDSDCCERCRTAFTLTNRKHHCRQCGATFCQQCSSKSVPLPHLGINDTVRVCDGCYIKVKLSKVADKETVPQLLGTAASISSSLTPAYTPSLKSKPASAANNATASNTNEDQFEDDLKKAIEMSLKESQQQQKLASFYGITSDKKDTFVADTSAVKKKSAEEEEEEANIAAAIAASLQDMKISSPREAKGVQYYSSVATSPKYNSNDLSSIDMENIQLFSTLMQRVQSAGGNVSGDTQINKLYTQIGTLQPKLVKTLDETSRKHDLFVNLHTKLNQAVRSYDKLIEDRLTATTQLNRASSYSSYYNSQPTSRLPYQHPPSHASVAYSYPAQQPPLPPSAQQPTYYSPYQSQPMTTPVVQHQQPVQIMQTQLPTQPVHLQQQAPPQQQQQYYNYYQASNTNVPPSPMTPSQNQQPQQQVTPYQEPQHTQQSQQYASNTSYCYDSHANNNYTTATSHQSQYYNKQPAVEEAPLIEL